jgi:hypothetical protein
VELYEIEEIPYPFLLNMSNKITCGVNVGNIILMRQFKILSYWALYLIVVGVIDSNLRPPAPKAGEEGIPGRIEEL